MPQRRGSDRESLMVVDNYPVTPIRDSDHRCHRVTRGSDTESLGVVTQSHRGSDRESPKPLIEPLAEPLDHPYSVEFFDDDTFKATCTRYSQGDAMTEPYQVLRLCTHSGCGEPCETGRCSEHPREQPGKASRHQRGYNNDWTRLSTRARKLQPWCSDCGTKDNLTADHLRWPARTLRDVDVVCITCNIKRGPARNGERETWGEGADEGPKDPRRMADKLSQSENGSHLGGA